MNNYSTLSTHSHPVAVRGPREPAWLRRLLVYQQRSAQESARPLAFHRLTSLRLLRLRLLLLLPPCSYTRRLLFSTEFTADELIKALLQTKSNNIWDMRINTFLSSNPCTCFLFNAPAYLFNV